MSTQTLEPNSSPEIHTSEDPSFKDTLKKLKQPINPDLIRQRAGNRDRNGNVNSYEFIEWHEVANILDEESPSWSHAVKTIQTIGDIIAITVSITIDGITREGIGTGPAASETGIKKAEHDALKRAAVKFGIARELYKKDFTPNSGQQGSSGNTRSAPQGSSTFDIDKPPTNPVAQSAGDLASAKQIGLIRSKSRYHKIDADARCYELLKCEIDNLNKRGASWFIDALEYIGESERADRGTSSGSNVTPINNGNRSQTPQEDPETRGRQLFKDGKVQQKENGYTVEDTIAGRDCVLDVNYQGQDAFSCTCGDYKNNELKGNKQYSCAHKMAAAFFTEHALSSAG